MVDGRVIITFHLNRLGEVMYITLACRDYFKLRREHTQPLKFDKVPYSLEHPVFHTAYRLGKAAFLRKSRV